MKYGVFIRYFDCAPPYRAMRSNLPESALDFDTREEAQAWADKHNKRRFFKCVWFVQEVCAATLNRETGVALAPNGCPACSPSPTDDPEPPDFWADAPAIADEIEAMPEWKRGVPPAAPEPDAVQLAPFDARPTQATRDAMTAAPELPEGWEIDPSHAVAWYPNAHNAKAIAVWNAPVRALQVTCDGDWPDVPLSVLRALLATQGLSIVDAKDRAVLEASGAVSQRWLDSYVNIITPTQADLQAFAWAAGRAGPEGEAVSRPDESADKCPVCGSRDLSFGYGFAGGGLGVYTFCLDCDEIISKKRTDTGDCFNGIQERSEP